MYESLYVISIFLHLISVFYGMKCIKIGEPIFCCERPSHFFSSRMERKFWTVLIGVFGNMLFIAIKPFYIINLEAHATGWQEPLWVSGHIAIAISTAIWHHMSYEEVKRLINEGSN